MKKTELVIFVLGALNTIFTGFNLMTKEKVVDAGEIQNPRNTKHSLTWSPLIGIALVIVGGGFMFFGAKNKS